MPSDNFASSPRKIDGPVRSAAAVVPHATNGIDTTRAIYVGGAGDITLRLVDDSTDQVFKAVPAGSLLPIRASFIRASGTTATSILALY